MLEPARGKSLMCTKSEDAAFSFLCERLQMREPCCVGGLIDMGKRILYRELIIFAQHNLSDHNIITHEIRDKSTHEAILSQIEGSPEEKPLIVLAYAASDTDISEFITVCQSVRDQRGHLFSAALVSDLAPLYQSFTNRDKIVVRSFLHQAPFNHDDSYSLISSFESRFNHAVDQKVKNKIFHLSGGGAGLIKSLFLLTKSHDLLNMTDEQIVQDTSIQYRLEALKNDIPGPIRARMESGLPLEDEDTRFLTVFGVLKENGRLFSPLLETYMNIKKDPLAFIAQSCTSTEISIVEFFQKNIDKPLSRDQIAQCLWGSDWEEKYSDWAIDQAIHRLRTKLRDANSPYSIQTKKGVGFVLKKN
ncbi:winged helix-turn-helix transcriptional regulator [Candidatus Woesebacteria bacterium]|nr:winged helix-turn-helix transcriptional regulator [Candidatus Woesebacteria bacterium]